MNTAPATYDIYAPQQVAEADPFMDMMQTEFGPEFGAQVGAPAVEGLVRLSPEEIDAQVAGFAADLSRMEATSEASDFDRNFLEANRITMRAMTNEELATVAENERRARVAALTEFAFWQLVSVDTDKKDTDDD